MPAISVIVNTYNSANFIQKTIQSVLAQTHTDFELIVIDDGSQDDTVNLVKTMQDHRIQVYPYPNGGIAKSRNRGISRASGEFIAFLDHDDLWHPQKLAQQLQAIKVSHDIALVHSWLEMVDEAGSHIRYLPKAHHSGCIYKELLTKNFLITASNPLIRRSALIEIDGFDENIYGADDWDLFLRLAQRYQVAVSPHYHIQYRVVQGSGSGQIAKFEKGCLQVVEKTFQQAEPQFQSLKDSALARIYQFLCFKTLQDMPQTNSGWLALRYLRKSRQLYPAIWGKNTLMKAVLKIGFAIALPRPIVQTVMPWLSERVREIDMSRAASAARYPFTQITCFRAATTSTKSRC